MKLKQLQVVFLCDDEVGEVEAVFDGNKLVSTWSNNDACMRTEYFAAMFAYMGYEIVDIVDASPAQVSAIRKRWGA